MLNYQVDKIKTFEYADIVKRISGESEQDYKGKMPGTERVHYHSDMHREGMLSAESIPA